MTPRSSRLVVVVTSILTLSLFLISACMHSSNAADVRAQGAPPATSPGHVLPDAIEEAQTPRAVPATRPEQIKSAHDSSDAFSATKASPSSTAFKDQPDEGKVKGFDFYRDPLDAKKPMQTFEETMAQDVADKPKVMAQQQRLLE